MKKKGLLLILLIMFMLSSCMRANRSLELRLCGAYAVPGMYYADLKGNATSIDIIEEDKYGRTLFEFTGPNAITGEQATSLVICQSINAEYVYYYEDQCYLHQNHTKSDIDSLKKQNDWDLPLEWDKMSSRPNVISLDLYIVPDLVLKSEDTRNAIINGLTNMGVVLSEYCLLDVNPNGYELHWITATSGGAVLNYFVMISPNYEIAFLPVADCRIDSNAIATFKHDNGWYALD